MSPASIYPKTPKFSVKRHSLQLMNQGYDTSAFLHHLSELADWRPSRVKILITSCPAASVEHVPCNTKLLRLKLDTNIINRDISAYVKLQLNALTILPDLQVFVQTAVHSKARGLFLYTKLVDTLLKEGVILEQRFVIYLKVCTICTPNFLTNT